VSTPVVAEWLCTMSALRPLTPRDIANARAFAVRLSAMSARVDCTVSALDALGGVLCSR
jgi:hypothetical protein